MNRPRNAPGRASRRFYLLLVLSVAVVLIAFLLLNPDGLFSLSALQGELDAAQASRDSLEHLRDSLRVRISLLQSDSTAMEEAVREILGWGRPGEFIIRFDRIQEAPH